MIRLLLLLLAGILQAAPTVVLDWAWAQGAGAPATGFSIQRSATKGGPYTPLTTVAPAILTYTDQSALTQGATYFYVVVPVGSAGPGPLSNEIALLMPAQAPPVPPAPSGCFVSASPATQPVVASGSAYTLDITAPPGCTWTATSNASWVTITSGASGTGNGKVNYTVGVNATTAARTGGVTVEQVVSIVQAGLAPPPPPSTLSVQITSVSTGRVYTIGVAAVSAKAYTDRAYTVSALDTLLYDGVLIRTSNEDDYVTAANHLQINLNRTATVYVLFDTRAQRLASWLSGWTATGKKSSTTANDFNIYSKSFPAGAVTLGGNERATTGAGAMSNYFVVVKP